MGGAGFSAIVVNHVNAQARGRGLFLTFPRFFFFPPGYFASPDNPRRRPSNYRTLAFPRASDSAAEQ